jgi:hypothetical protein
MLEYWNDGILGSGIMEEWAIGRIFLGRKVKYYNKCVTFS